jgi:hypothetical protein
MRTKAIFCLALYVFSTHLLLACRAAAQEVPSALEGVRLTRSFAELPLGFEENQGQAEAGVRFLTHSPGYSVYLSRGSLLVRFDQKRGERNKAEEIRIGITGADDSVEPRGIGRLQGTVNYYIGTDPAHWKAGLSRFSRVSYTNIYPGINLVFYGNRQHLEFDFEVAPGRDVSAIALNVDGAVIKAGQGDLRLTTPSGKTLTLKRPALFQGAGPARRSVAGGYVVRKPHQVGFSAGNYDKRQGLVIDPALVYSTLVGVALRDKVPFAIAVDGSGAAYITGQAMSPGPVDSAFVVKLDPSGSTLLYETHLGGIQPVSGDTLASGFGIGVDPSGNAYVAGLTMETDFPTTAGAFSTAAFCAVTSGGVGCEEPFAFKLDANGKLMYSTFLVQTTVDDAGPVPSAVAVDSTGAFYVTGTTAQQGNPAVGVARLLTTPGAFQTSRKNNSSAFVIKLHPDGSKLDYSTYLGGSTGETPGGIAVDADGIAYVDGGTSSSDFPVTAGASLTTNPGTAAFYSTIKADGSGLLYSTFLAGNGETEGTSIAIDSGLAAYLTGVSGTNCSVTQSLPAFAAKFDATGNLAYSTSVGSQTCAPDLFYFGAPPPSSIAVDNTGAAYVANGSGGFFNASINEIKLDSSGAVVNTKLVGPINSHNSRFGGAALDTHQNFIVTGVAGTLLDPPGGPQINGIMPDISTTVGAFQTLPIDAIGNPNDPQETMFVQKWTQSLGAAVPIPNPRQVVFSPTLQPGITSTPRTIQIFNYGDATLAFNGATLGGANATDFAISSNNNTCGATLDAGPSPCSFQVTFTPTGGGSRNATVTLSFGGGLASQTVALVGQSGTPVFSPSPSPVDFGNVEVGATSLLMNLTIANTGTGPMNLLTWPPAIQGANSSDFSICVLVTGHCTPGLLPPGTIPPGSSLNVPLVFMPSGSGGRNAQIVFTTDVPGSPQMVQLQGNGVPAGNGGFNLNGSGSSTATVTAGQTATYNLLAVTNQAITLSITCSGTPSAASCNVTPNSVSLTPGPKGSGPQSLAVSVTTTPRTSASLRRMLPSLAWPVVAIVGLVGLRRKRRGARLIIMFSVLAVLGMTLSCGGGSSNNGGGHGGGNTGTPAGTYTLTVTATGNGSSNSMPLTLNVQ